MFSLPEHWLGDAWYYTEGGVVHMYYLHCTQDIPRHTRWSIGHATSTDLIHWTNHGVLFSSNPLDPSRSCLSTGSVTRYGDGYLMAFLANHNAANPRVIYAQSRDLFRWQELPLAECALYASNYGRRGSRPFKNPRWRDPYLFEHEGWLHQLMTAADDRLDPEADGVVGHMRTQDLCRWEFLPPLQLFGVGTDLECPKLYQLGDRFVLLVSMFTMLQSESFRARQPDHLNGNTTFRFAADKLAGPYHCKGSGRVLDQDQPGGPYACEAVLLDEQWYLLGTCWSDRLGDRISDPIKIDL